MVLNESQVILLIELGMYLGLLNRDGKFLIFEMFW